LRRRWPPTNGFGIHSLTAVLQRAPTVAPVPQHMGRPASEARTAGSDPEPHFSAAERTIELDH